MSLAENILIMLALMGLVFLGYYMLFIRPVHRYENRDKFVEKENKEEYVENKEEYVENKEEIVENNEAYLE
jgi:Na+-transporting methylmalonyl-CoA/oxaloacetate decarboxylase gamma subunit